MKYLIYFLLFINVSFVTNANASSNNVEGMVQVKEGDLVLGDPNSSIVLVEYSSLGCPHCADFHKYVFPKIKEEYITPKKVKYIYRDFPNNPSSTLGAMLAICNGDKRAKTLEVLFDSQQLWAFQYDFEEKLKEIMALGGMSSEDFYACAHNQDLRDKVFSRGYEASKTYGINKTPVLFVNGTQVENIMSINDIKTAIDHNISR